MQFETWTKGLAELSVDCIAVGVHDDGELTPEAKVLDLRCREKLSRLVKRGDFTAKAGETWLLTDLDGIAASCRVTNPASRRVLEKCGFQWTGVGLLRVRSLEASTPVDQFRLERRTWASLRAWGQSSMPRVASGRP